MRDFEIDSMIKNTATTCSHPGAANQNLYIPPRLHHDLSIDNMVNINPMSMSHNVSNIHLERPKKAEEHQEGAGTIEFIHEEGEDLSNDTDLFVGTVTAITTTVYEGQKEIGVNDGKPAKDATKTGGSGVTVEGEDNDIAENFAIGDVELTVYLYT